ncbi:MAG: N-acetylmuramoyl-L-alanine amidase [Sulfitobacter sp.]
MLRRSFYGIMLAFGLATGAAGQELTALARVHKDNSQISDGWLGGTTLELHLTQGVPFRVFTLNDPARLVVDFKEVDWSGIKPADILTKSGSISALRFGAFQPGWSRLVADLSQPMLPRDIAMPIDQNSGDARLSILLKPVELEEFSAKSGAPRDASWTMGLKPRDLPPPAAGKDRFTVVIDPGHGGIDPGAERGGVSEKDLMLSIGRALAEALRRAGVDAVLTREDDRFVALETRVAVAHRVKGDLFLSLHADVLTEGRARGATVYTLSQDASDAATEHLAARHDRSDIIAGADLTGSDDQVAGVLLDLARQETEPRSAALAERLIAHMTNAGGPMNRRPHRRAGFSVLKSADIPSVLIEVGFLSSERDLANLRDPVWRAVMVEALANGVLEWRDRDAALKPLLRQ